MKEKFCPSCKQLLSITSFWKCSSRYDGLRAYCKNCSVKKMSEYLSKYHKDKYRNDEEFRNTIIARNKEYKRTNKIIINAHALIQQRVKRNVLKKLPCAICEKNNTQAHHSSYRFPRDVIWLCPRHHKLLHNKNLMQDMDIV